MSLPKKISPDRIKDAIIEFSVVYSKPYEVILGLILDEVINNSSYKFINSSNNIPLEIHELARRYLFYNDKIKFHLSPKTITINCFSNYISWEIYLKEIQNIINIINKINSKIKVIRIGLRYVSEYVDIDFKDCLKFDFSFGYPDIKSKHYSFNSEFVYKKALIILTLRNMMPTQVSNETKSLSHIDIDVIKKDLDIQLFNKERVIELLNEIHSYEKEVFFNLLKDDFLNTLEPKY